MVVPIRAVADFFPWSVVMLVMGVRRFLVLILCLFSFQISLAKAQAGTHDADALWQRQRERDEQLHRLQTPEPDVRLDVRQPVTTLRLPATEQPCFVIEAIRFDSEETERLAWLADAVDVDSAGQPDPASGRCLGTGSVQILLQRLQQALMKHGLATTRVLAAPQDLSRGVLTLTVIPGRIRALRFTDGTASRATMGNAMPLQSGDLLDLHALEHGLENFRRLPSVGSDLQIMPSADPKARAGDSDVLVRWTQQRPWRLNLSVDDAGIPTTGRLQSALTFAVDHGLALNDLFYLTISDAIGDRLPGPRDARSRTVHYALPWREWLLSTTHGDWNYFQSVTGRDSTIIYSGRSQSSDITLGRLLYRDAQRKTTGSLRLWQRSSSNHIDDTELLQQRRSTGGWELGLSHRERLDTALLDASLVWRRGTGAFGATAAPEEAYGEGSSRMQLLRTDISLSRPFMLASQSLRYSAALRRQWNFTPLTPQDRFAIGNRYTVRGFDGESVLSGDRGWLLRQELGWSLAALRSELYVGIDTARVGGPSASRLAGRGLTGVAVGVRGTARGVAWDAFVGQPLSRPEGFRTADVTGGFYLSASY